MIDAQPSSQGEGEGFEFTLELGTDQLVTEELRNAIPDTRMEPGGDNKLVVRWYHD